MGPRTWLVLSAVALAHAYILHYTDVEISPGDTDMMQRVTMYSQADTPYGDSPSTVEIDLKLSMYNPAAGARGPIVMLLVGYKDIDYVGQQVDANTKRFCCTPDLVALNNACTLGEIYIPSSPREEAIRKFMVVTQLDATNTSTQTASINKDYVIEQWDAYSLYVFSCTLDTGMVLLNGDVRWRNPYGFLPGEEYPLLPFYGVMSLLYLLIGFVWMGFSLRHWRILLKLQFWIAVVIFLGMVEMATWYFDYLTMNNTGKHATGPIVFGVIVSTAKRTLSRFLLLIVCMGYGVVKPTLGQTMYKVTFLNVVYAVFSLTISLYERLRDTTKSASPAMLILFVVPVSLIDATFLWWSILSLSRIITHLKTRNQSVKLSMYTRFGAVLVLAALVSVVLILYQFISAMRDIMLQWRTEWTFDALWQMLFFVILLAIMVIWRPTKNNQRYAMEQLSGEPVDDGTDGHPIANFSDVRSRRGRDESDEESGEESPDVRAQGQSGKMGTITAAAFTIAADEEDRPKRDNKLA